MAPKTSPLPFINFKPKRSKSFTSFRIRVSNGKEAIDFLSFAPFLDKSRGIIERAVWLLVFFICICSCAAVVYYLVRNYMNSSIVVTVEPSDNGIVGEDFPAVTVCNIRKWLAKGVPQESVDDMLQTSIDRRKFALPYCSYQNTYYKCEQIMKLILTDWETFCYTFNYAQPEKYPVVNEENEYNSSKPFLRKFEDTQLRDKEQMKQLLCSGLGLVNGLSFMTDVLRKENGGEEINSLVEVKRHCLGFMVKVHGPEEFPIMTQGSVHVTPGLENNIIVEPFKVVTTDNVLNHPSANRRKECYLNGEKNLTYFQYYTFSACQMECRLNVTLLKCGCRHWTAPGNPNDNICSNESEVDCYMKTSAKLSKGSAEEYVNYAKMCRCKRRCNYRFFKFTVSTALVDAEGVSKRFNKSVEYYRYNMVIVNVFFGDTTLTTFKRDVLNTLSSLCSSVGGIIGSILGWSLLTIARIFVPALFGFRCKATVSRRQVTIHAKPISVKVSPE